MILRLQNNVKILFNYVASVHILCRDSVTIWNDTSRSLLHVGFSLQYLTYVCTVTTMSFCTIPNWIVHYLIVPKSSVRQRFTAPFAGFLWSGMSPVFRTTSTQIKYFFSRQRLAARFARFFRSWMLWTVFATFRQIEMHCEHASSPKFQIMTGRSTYLPISRARLHLSSWHVQVRKNRTLTLPLSGIPHLLEGSPAVHTNNARNIAPRNMLIAIIMCGTMNRRSRRWNW